MNKNEKSIKLWINKMERAHRIQQCKSANPLLCFATFAWSIREYRAESGFGSCFCLGCESSLIIDSESTVVFWFFSFFNSSREGNSAWHAYLPFAPLLFLRTDSGFFCFCFIRHHRKGPRNFRRPPQPAAPTAAHHCHHHHH